MDSLTLSVMLFIIGAVTYTVISYIAKYLKNPETKFNMLYLMTALLSMFLVIMLAPTFLLPGILPFAVSGATGTGYIIVASFSMGLTGNFFLNLPLTYLLKKLSEANVTSLTSIKPSWKYLLYALATIALIGLVFGASVYAVVQYQASIHTTGTIKTVGVKIYSDAALSNELVKIDWGLRPPGSEVSVEMWVQNTGNSPVTLTFYTSNWNPATAGDYMTLSWDYAGQTINPSAAQKITLTLSVSAEISGITNFSFDITVVAS